MTDLAWRSAVQREDILAIRKLADSTQVFSTEEVAVAGELVEEKLMQGEKCSYHFLFAEKDNQIIAYSCFGLIPFTQKRVDLYWIAVNPIFQKQGLGQQVLRRSEEAILVLGGRRVYLETSSRAIYEPTRRFYHRNGYLEISELKDFYSDGDNKVIYCKEL